MSSDACKPNKIVTQKIIGNIFPCLLCLWKLSRIVYRLHQAIIYVIEAENSDAILHFTDLKTDFFRIVRNNCSV